MMFTEYMDSTLKKHGTLKSRVARASGISEDYLYKLFAGTKRTAVRDYVIGICRAIGMDVVETQIALTLNDMPVLDPRDKRDSILMRCIMDNRNIRLTNESLEENGLDWLESRRSETWKRR